MIEWAYLGNGVVTKSLVFSVAIPVSENVTTCWHQWKLRFPDTNQHLSPMHSCNAIKMLLQVLAPLFDHLCARRVGLFCSYFLLSVVWWMLFPDDHSSAWGAHRWGRKRKTVLEAPHRRHASRARAAERLAEVSNPPPGMAVNAAQHEVANLLKTFFFF